jgi:hypothetical protein
MAWRRQDQRYALTLAFTTFVLFQFFNAFNARAEYGSAFNANFLQQRQAVAGAWRACSKQCNHKWPISK